MNHKNRTPYIPLPPALPRFSLPHDAVDELDPLDVASTSQRPTVRPGSRPIIRKKIAADATSEVQVEDILLEVYAEEPPPPMTWRSPGVAPVAQPAAAAPAAARPVRADSSVDSVEARASIAMAIASIVPPPPAQSAAVDALLRASDPAFAPYVPYAPYGARPAHAHGSAADYETPSVGPMMMSTAAPPARPVLADARPAPAKRRGLALAIWATAIVVLGVAAGGGGVMAVRNGTYARLRDGAKSATLRATARHDAPVAAAAPAAPPVAAPAPVAPSATTTTTTATASAGPSAVPTVSIDSLPKPAIAADASLVTFPSYAEGHRIFLDGRVLPVALGTPTRIKCGRHMLKIGSGRKPRVVDFACGREVIVQ